MSYSGEIFEEVSQVHKALYRKWRPQTFDEVCGQEHITSILKYEIDNSKFSHAYLFCGSRGTGKTTCAKILSRAVNCLSPVGGNPCGKCEACLAIEAGTATDVLEMDAASNNGVDNIRDIRDEVVYAPSTLKYRVYIIDEVHMLSSSAFNALLKTLEEPPEHVVFILATTELHKLPSTIISRCQRFDFRRISTEALKDRLLYIAKNEGIELDPDAAVMLAKQAQGGMRDAISLLELCAGSRERITPELVNITVGCGGRDEMIRVCDAVCRRDYEVLFGAIDEVVRSSRDMTVFWQELISLYRDLLIIKTSKNASNYLDLTDSELREMKALSEKMSREQLLYHCTLLEDALFSMQKANSVRRIVAELTLVKMCDASLSTSTDALLMRIAALETKLSNIELGIQSVGSVDKPQSPNTQSTKAGAGRDTRGRRRVYDDDDEDFRSDAPTQAAVGQARVTQQGGANIPSATSVDSQSTGSVGSGGAVRQLRQIKGRAEAIERLMQADTMLASFYKSAKWYSDNDGHIVLKFPDKYASENAKFFDSKGVFLKVISHTLGVQLRADDILYEYDEAGKAVSVIDEILDAASEE